MKQLKKQSIGFNTVSSIDGIINARGVKSKPNNLEIFGYTHQIGEGEKSLDNPYELVSLDSGNVNLYSEDKITDIQVTNEGATRKGFEIEASEFASKHCVIYFNTSKSTIGNSSDENIINVKYIYADGTYENWSNNSMILNKKIKILPENVSKIILYSGGTSSDNKFSLYEDLMVLDNPIMPDEYITDEHSIALSNGDTTIQVPVPIALNSIKGVSDYIFKDSDGIWKLMQNIKKFTIDENIKNVYFVLQDQYGGVVKFATRFPDMDGKIVNESKILCDKLLSLYSNMNFYEHIRNSNSDYPNSLILYIKISRMTENDTVTEDEILAYLKENPIEVLYQVENPYYHKLSDYAQDLLNSFELKNQNRIFVDGNPDIKISGYIKK